MRPKALPKRVLSRADDSKHAARHRRGTPLKLAILFWIYKDLPLCTERAELLRVLNPDLAIYGLFGGDLLEADAFETALSPWLDDFYVFSEDRLVEWKWLQGDQMIGRWFTERGRAFEWDTIFIAQWDLLTLSPLSKLCAGLKPGQILLPGLRPIREVADWWQWVRPNTTEKADFDRFRELVSRTHSLPDEPLCCSFPAGALPRRFLEKYVKIPEPEVGFLEYKMPLYAQLWGIEFCHDHPFRLIWQDRYRDKPMQRFLKTFHAEKQPVRTSVMLWNAVVPWGERVFHPYTKPLPSALRPSRRRRGGTATRRALAR
jgi:hypothetical protein